MATFDVKLITLVCTILLSPLMSATVSAGEKDKISIDPGTPRSPWRISLGVTWQEMGCVTFSGRGYSNSGLINAALASELSGQPSLSEAGPAGDFGNRSYDNGFVRIGAGTANPVAVDPTATSNFGYASSSQIQGNILAYQRRGITPSSLIGGHSRKTSGSEEDDSFSPYVQLQYLLDLTKRIRFGPQFSFKYAQMDTSRVGSTFSQRGASAGSEALLEDRYNLQGVILPAGPFNGSFSGPGPLIDNIPTTRTITTLGGGGFGDFSYRNRIRETFESNNYDLTAGVGVEVDVFSGVYAFLGGGLSVRVSDFRATYAEYLELQNGDSRPSTLGKWKRETSDVDLLFGGYVQAGVGVRITRNVALNGFFRYDWLQGLGGNVGASFFYWNANSPSIGLSIAIAF